MTTIQLSARKNKLGVQYKSKLLGVLIRVKHF